MNDKQLVTQALAAVLDGALNETALANLLETPKQSEMGDLAFPAFSLAKTLRKAPQVIAAEIAERLSTVGFEKVVAVGPYVNFFLDKAATTTAVLSDILRQGSDYGTVAQTGENIAIDLSSPNIAKPFSIGHLRSTVIGDALAKIYQKIGYHPIKINHLGDWGKQFGMLIVAYQKYGDEAAVRQNPISELLKLYVRINAEAETDPTIDEAARDWFLKLETGDPEALALWQWFRDESLVEFDRIYTELGVEFDSMNGEAFYNDKMAEIIDILEAKHLLTLSEGATVVELEGFEHPALIKKSDGATLYITRDLAAALYRKRTYKFVKSLYVVGQEQSGHFKQLKAVLEKMDYDWSDDIEHVPFGLVTRAGKKLSTRKGNVILLEPTIHEAISRAQAQIDAKNPDLPNKAAVAHAVGVGAIKFYDLKNERLNGYDFNLEDMVSFEGETGPYVQYAHARIQSILRKADFQPAEVAGLDLSLKDAESWEIIKLLQTFSEFVARAARTFEPSVIAKYVINLAQAFNKYYAHTRILDDNADRPARLALSYATGVVLKESLRLLGVEAPSEM
ncbi:MAG: arginine--tRNA ligase [Streptococcaceae bacterium]|jgi:arginyl-tRNA synthetase|nr:arginine--tRNA ligase [Streptococcaceae bacterium]